MRNVSGSARHLYDDIKAEIKQVALSGDVRTLFKSEINSDQARKDELYTWLLRRWRSNAYLRRLHQWKRKTGKKFTEQHWTTIEKMKKSGIGSTRIQYIK